METRRLLWWGVAHLSLHAAALTTPATAQTAPAPPAQTAPSVPAAPATAGKQVLYSKEQLDQMLAPIALYPDALLAQILMAATYPIEVVEASPPPASLTLIERASGKTVIVRPKSRVIGCAP